MDLKRPLRFNFLLSCVLVLSWCCGSDSGEAGDVIYKVGSFEATRYEVDRSFENYTKSHQRINERLLESWMDDMRTRSYFLADAYASHYDTLLVIQKKLDYALKYKVAQEGGYLWNRNVAPMLRVSDAEVADGYTKREDVYYVDLLFFSDERTLKEVNKRFTGRLPMFHELVKEARERPGVEFASLPLIYPFTHLASVREEVYDMKVGDVLGPVSEPEGSYIILLTRKQKRNFLPIEKDRPYIEQDLLSVKRKLAIHLKQDSVYRTSKVELHDLNIERLSDALKNKTTGAAEMDTSVLMTYYLDKSEYRFLGKDYEEFIKYTPVLVGDFADPQQIRNNLRDHLIRTYLYEEARRIGLTADKTFLLEKRHYYHALLEQHYYAEEFEKKIDISEQALVDYYNENQNSFPAEQIAWVSFIEFASEHSARNGISYFQSVLARGDVPKLSDTAAVKGILDIKAPEMISGTNTMWGETRKQFIDAELNMLYGPIRHNNRVYLYHVSKKGVENVKEFSTVRDKIHARLKLARMEELKLKKVNDLRMQFKEDTDGLKIYCEARKDKN